MRVVGGIPELECKFIAQESNQFATKVSRGLEIGDHDFECRINLAEQLRRVDYGQLAYKPKGRVSSELKLSTVFEPGFVNEAVSKAGVKQIRVLLAFERREHGPRKYAEVLPDFPRAPIGSEMEPGERVERDNRKESCREAVTNRSGPVCRVQVVSSYAGRELFREVIAAEV